MGVTNLKSGSFALQAGNGLLIKGEVIGTDDGTCKPVVILGHGFRGHKDWAFWPDVARRLAANGFCSVRFDYSRVFARNDGADERQVAAASTLTRELLDLEIVVRELRTGRLPLPELADGSKLAILGHSRAGGSHIVFASENPDVNALVVWNGGAAPVRHRQPGDAEPGLQEQAIEEDLQNHAERFRLGDRFAALSVPALIVQGDRDRSELLEQFAALRVIAPHQRYVAIQEADHVFNATDPYEGPTPQLLEALDVTIRFLQDQFG